MRSEALSKGVKFYDQYLISRLMLPQYFFQELSEYFYEEIPRSLKWFFKISVKLDHSLFQLYH